MWVSFYLNVSGPEIHVKFVALSTLSCLLGPLLALSLLLLLSERQFLIYTLWPSPSLVRSYSGSLLLKSRLLKITPPTDGVGTC